MARRLVADDQQMFRVVIVARQRRDNPKWERGNLSSPRFLWDGPEYTATYGPYTTLGAARGQLTHHTTDAYGNAMNGVVSGHIEQAHTTWTPIDQPPPADFAAFAAAALVTVAALVEGLRPDHELDPGRGEVASMLRRKAAYLTTQEQTQ